MLQSALLCKSGLKAFAIIAVATAFLVTAETAGAVEQKHLNKKEVKALISVARTPADHMQLAQYYKAEADKLEAEAKDHDELAAAYRKSSMSKVAAMKVPMAPNTAAHCEYFAKSVREAAKAAREMAASHEQMAKDASANRQ